MIILNGIESTNIESMPKATTRKIILDGIERISYVAIREYVDSMIILDGIESTICKFWIVNFSY